MRRRAPRTTPRAAPACSSWRASSPPTRRRATVLFICYAGEEQGLYGSEDHAADLVAAGDDARVEGMLDLDMIGFTADAELDCLLESEPSRQPGLVGLRRRPPPSSPRWRSSPRTRRLGLGPRALPGPRHAGPAGDRERLGGTYTYYHRTYDLPANLDLDMGGQVLRMGAGALADLAGADESLIFHDGFESGTTSAWSDVAPR